MLERGSLPGREATLELEDGRGLSDAGALAAAGLPVRRIASESAAVLDEALSLPIDEVEVAPGRATEAWLARNRGVARPRIVVRPAPRARLSLCREHDLEPARLSALLEGSEVFVEDLPPCLAGHRPSRFTPPVLEPETTGGLAGPVDLELLVSRFGASANRASSARCRGCALVAGCKGLHVERLRAFGLACLRPV
jgi:hypothetical protein